MSQTLPPGVTPERFAAALAGFAAIVGDEHVQTSEEVLAAHQDEVRVIVRLASELRVPLWTVSTGRNLGYGASAPRVRGCVVLELSRMNRILEVNEKLGYVLVEPGVRFFDLYDHLQREGIALWVSVPGLGWGSVTGNALERGLGSTPYGDHSGNTCGSFFFAPRYLSHVYMIAFDRDDWDEAQRARELVEVLVRDGAAEGYGEYRAHVDFMDLIAEQYDFNDGAMGRFNARIKGALDPQGILSPRQAGHLAGGGAVVAVRQRLGGAGGRARAVRRVLVAGEFRHTSPWSVILALDGLAAPCTTLTVAVVAEHPGCTGLLIALLGGAVRRAAPRSGAGGLRSRVQAGRPGAARRHRRAPRHGRLARTRAARLRAALRARSSSGSRRAGCATAGGCAARAGRSAARDPFKRLT